MLILTRKPGEIVKIGNDNTNFLNIITIMQLSITS
ncbi:MAG: carbon storage regulator [Candidatus Brocadiaceae bacterium]|nr:carbon storage regulator [Candidatus Brocadiaceae bacterium]